jgi:hypothetical protein
MMCTAHLEVDPGSFRITCCSGRHCAPPLMLGVGRQKETGWDRRGDIQ